MRTSDWLTPAAALLLVAVVTAVQGMWTDRWSNQSRNADLERAAKLLEARFPRQFGEWREERELESDPKELTRAGAVGHVSRLYRNSRSKARVSAFVVCALPHDASGHTPDRCYPGAGFEIGESEHRQTIDLADGGTAESFTGTFRKAGQTLRVFWTYGVRDADDAKQGTGPPGRQWIAPQIARIALAREPAVFKLYAIVDETKLTSAQAIVECEDFIANLLPAFATALAETRAGDDAGPAGGPSPADGNAAPATDAAGFAPASPVATAAAGR